jgi:hypothetical protein
MKFVSENAEADPANRMTAITRRGQSFPWMISRTPKI